jgi:hypothetical protein
MRIPGFKLVAVFALAAAAPPVFEDIAAKSGIGVTIVSGSLKKDYVVEVNGSGGCWFDYDSDGFIDLYLVNGTTLEQIQKGAPQKTTNHLFRNNGDGTFRDVTARTGVGGRGWGFGCVAADYDNDGRTDLFVSNFGPNILYRNRGDGSFEDATARAGVAGGDIWHAGAAFGDYDRDGHLDLFVPGYLDFNLRKPELKACEYRGIQVRACGPMGYRGAPDLLFRNNGDGTFSDATSRAKVTDGGLYFGFQAVFEDFDGDGYPDIFVANDSNPNYLYLNKRNGTFEETGVAAGVAYSSNGKEMSSMGVAVGDYDRDGLMDIFVTTFANDNYVLFHNDGDGFFTDVSYPSGVGEATIPYLGWGTCFLDYDNDGFSDLFMANGHVYPEVDGALRETYRQPLQLFRNLGSGKFRDVSESTGLRGLKPRSARGAACGDFNNDGFVDVVVSNIDDTPQLLRNRGTDGSHWIALQLQGTKSNRSAVGAKVKLTAGGAVQHATVRAGGNFLSGDDMRVHFGLGSHTGGVTAEVTWPLGAKENFQISKIDRVVALREGGQE